MLVLMSRQIVAKYAFRAGCSTKRCFKPAPPRVIGIFAEIFKRFVDDGDEVVGDLFVDR